MKENKTKIKNNTFANVAIIFSLIFLIFSFGISMAWFTDKKESSTTIQFGNINLDENSANSFNFAAEKVIPGQVVANGDVKVSPLATSQSMYIRAKFSISADETTLSSNELIRNLQIEWTNTLKSTILSELRFGNTSTYAWSLPQIDGYSYLMGKTNSEVNTVPLATIGGSATEYIFISNGMTIPTSTQSLANNSQYGVKLNFSIAFQALQVANVDNSTFDSVKSIFNDTFGIVTSISSSQSLNSNTLGVNSTVETNLNNYYIYGKSFQNTTPIPSAPVDVVSLGEEGAININANSKNLFQGVGQGVANFDNYQNRTSEEIVFGTTPYSTNESMYKINGEISDSNIDTAWKFLSKTITIKPSTVYTCSFYAKSENSATQLFFTNVADYGYSCRMIWENGTFSLKSTVEYYGAEWVRITFTGTSPAEGKNVVIQIGADAGNIYNSTACAIYIADIQFEEGSTATEYQSYYSQTKTINMAGHEPLRKVGDVADYIDYANQRIVRNVGTYTFTGAEIWSGPARVNGTGWAMQSQCVRGYNNSPIVIRAISNYLIGATYYNVKVDAICLHDNGYGSIIVILSDSVTGLNAGSSGTQINTGIQNFLKTKYDGGTPVIAYYQLKTPTYEALVCPKIEIPSGDCILTVSDGTIIASKFEVAY